MASSESFWFMIEIQTIKDVCQESLQIFFLENHYACLIINLISQIGVHFTTSNLKSDWNHDSNVHLLFSLACSHLLKILKIQLS